MQRKLIISRKLPTVIYILVIALTSITLAADAIADERGRRSGTRLEQTQGKRVESKRSRSYDNRPQRAQGKRVERERSRSYDNRPQRAQGKRVESKRSRSYDNRLYRTQGKRVERSHPRKRWNNKRRVISPRSMRYGNVVRKLPRGYKRSWYNRVPYYYRHGVFYRPGLSGYIVVRAPFGAIVVSLPVGYQTLWVNDSVYYAYGGYFYRRVPAGFVVVEPPETVEFEEVDPDIVQPSQTAAGEVSVTASVLNVRSGPSLNDPKIYQIHEGYILEIHGKSNRWLYVQLPNGEFGWALAEFTKPLEPGSG